MAWEARWPPSLHANSTVLGCYNCHQMHPCLACSLLKEALRVCDTCCCLAAAGLQGESRADDRLRALGEVESAYASYPFLHPARHAAVLREKGALLVSQRKYVSDWQRTPAASCTMLATSHVQMLSTTCGVCRFRLSETSRQNVAGSCKMDLSTKLPAMARCRIPPWSAICGW